MKKKIKNSKTSLRLIDKIKNVFYFIGILLIGFIGIYCLAKIGVFNDKKEVDKIKKNKSITVGTIIKVGSMKGSYAVAEYYDKNKRYERKDDSPAEDIYIGEHYEVLYDSISPEQSRIDFTKPIFLKEQITKITSGRIVSTDWAKVEFSYLINGVEYSRFQKLSEGKTVKKNQTYSVEYLINSPQIAVLKID